MPSVKAEMKSIIQKSVRTTIRNALASVIQEIKIAKEGRENPAEGKAPHRIQTQIHRRKKAKAVAPLTNEWERSRTMPPKNLKRSPQDMQKS